MAFSNINFLPFFSIIARTVGMGTRESNRKNVKLKSEFSGIHSLLT